MEDFRELVASTWNQQGSVATPEQLNNKLTTLKRAIKYWKRKRIGDIHLQEEICKEVIAWLDRQLEIRSITNYKN
jgi:hypothetical protein